MECSSRMEISPTISAWGNIKERAINFFTPEAYKHERTIRELTGRVTAEWQPSEGEKREIKEALEKIHSLFGTGLRGELRKLPLDKIQEIIGEMKNIEECLAIFHTDQLRTLLEIQNGQLGNDQELAKDAIKGVMKGKIMPLIKEILPQLLKFIHHVLGLLISVTGIQDIEPSEHSLFSESNMGQGQSQVKLSLILTIIGYPAVLFGIIYGAIGILPITICLVTAITVASIAFLILYNRYLKPNPSDCQGYKNLNAEMLDQSKNKDPIHKRMDIIHEIEAAFEEGKSVILHGKSGIGKTVIAETLAQYYMKNKPTVNLFSPDTKVSVNTVSWDGSSLAMAKKRFKNCNDEVRFFFDEIHTFFKNQAGEAGASYEDLKIFTGQFRVLGATTTEEYEQHIKSKDKAIDRRFKYIQVDEMTPEDVEQIIKKTFEKRNPELKCTPNFISHLVKRSEEYDPETSQIGASKELLTHCLYHATHLSLNGLQKEINHLKGDIGSLSFDLKQNYSQDKGNLFIEKKGVLEVKKRELNMKLQELEEIRKIERQRYAMQTKALSVAGKDEAAWLRCKVTEKIMLKSIKRKREALGLPLKLNEEFIDECLEKERGND